MTRDMTPAERCAYDEGIRATVDAAREAVITIEIAEDAGTFRKRLVAEALAAFADAAESLKLAVSHAPVPRRPASHCGRSGHIRRDNLSQVRWVRTLNLSHRG